MNAISRLNVACISIAKTTPKAKFSVGTILLDETEGLFYVIDEVKYLTKVDHSLMYGVFDKDVTESLPTYWYSVTAYDSLNKAMNSKKDHMENLSEFLSECAVAGVEWFVEPQIKDFPVVGATTWAE